MAARKKTPQAADRPPDEPVFHLWELGEALRCFVKAAARLTDLRTITRSQITDAMLYGARGMLHLAKTDPAGDSLEKAIESVQRALEVDAAKRRGR